MQEIHFDIVVTGGGMVGAALACGLCQQGFRVAVVEERQPVPFAITGAPDLRISAIGRASVDLLRQLGVWPDIQAMRCAPYRKLETWEWSGARVQFDAQSLRLPELGYMVENQVIQLALWQCLQQQAVQCYCPARLTGLTPHATGWRLTLDSGESLSTRLVIGADGANSRVRQLAGIGIRGWQYSQACMLISVRRDQSAGDTTWQQFTAQGPRAYLPLFGSWASLVWYDHPAQIRRLKSLPLAQLEQAIRANFPPLPGNFSAFSAGAFPLVRRHAARYIMPGLALAGDAAHTINPLAGQGVNLGYRDVNALIEVLTTARNGAEDWSSVEVLQRYQQRRFMDNQLMQWGMDAFYFAFSNPVIPLKIIRNLGFIAAEHSGELKRRALRYALGL